MNKKIIIPVIIGPTASGKTAIAIKLALKINAEIISCDSRQVYKYMDIGTAKPTKLEQETVPHHLLDIITPDSSFSFADFANLAKKAIDQVINKGKIPLIVGGTGFYLDGLINGIPQFEIDNNQAQILRQKLELKETTYLVNELIKLDIKAASKIKFNDRQRLIRAIIVSKLTGKPFSSFNDKKIKNNNYEYLIFGLTKPRNILYNDINRRVEEMIKLGLLDEVKSLLNMGYNQNMPGLKTIGYSECIDYLNGTFTFSEMLEKIKQHTRNYAKRQLTYFKKFTLFKWLERNENKVSDDEILQTLVLNIKNALKI